MFGKYCRDMFHGFLLGGRGLGARCKDLLTLFLESLDVSVWSSSGLNLIWSDSKKRSIKRLYIHMCCVFCLLHVDQLMSKVSSRHMKINWRFCSSFQRRGTSSPLWNVQLCFDAFCTWSSVQWTMKIIKVIRSQTNFSLSRSCVSPRGHSSSQTIDKH